MRTSNLLDIYPTLCELLGVDAPESVEGKSMVPSINSNDDKGRETIFMGYTEVHRAVKDRQYKLIEYNVEGVRNTQLFDLDNDPWETANLAENQEYSDKLCELRKKLLEYREEWDDDTERWGIPFWDGVEF